MFNEMEINEIEKKCRNLTCPDCGRTHDVAIIYDERNEAIRPYSPEPICEGFSLAVHNLIKTEVSRLLNEWPL